MRFGRWGRPRRRDPRRRFRNRLLVGMVGVALLPLVAFAVLAVFELDTVAKSTANETETSILEHQQGLAQSGLESHASFLDRTMGDINAQVQTLGSALVKVKTSLPAAPLVEGGATIVGTDKYLNEGTSTLLFPATGPVPGSQLASASASPALDKTIQALLKDGEVLSVWFEDQSGVLRLYPPLTSAALFAHRYDAKTPKLRDGLGVLDNSEGGIGAASEPNVWDQPGTPGKNADGPFWTDPYPLIADGTMNVSSWYQASPTERVGVDVSLQKLLAPAIGPAILGNAGPLLITASGTLLTTSAAFPDAAQYLTFTVAGQTEFMSSIRHLEQTGATPRSPLTLTLNKVKTDVFTAPVYGSHWIMATPVSVSTLEPDLSALTLGVNDVFHRLFPVTVLPVLILLVGLAFLATTLLSRRMYLPVQALTDHAVLEERTRLAREIHDTLAQQLTGIVLELEAADTLLNRGSEGRARTSVEKARELARGALQEARRSVWNLRPALLSATGLVAAIGHEVEAWEDRTGIPARFKARAVPQHPSLSPTAEVALLRIGQEALSNAARHGRPEHVDVELRAHAQELILSVSDDGIGFDPSASAPREDCFGLDGMAERARSAGGTLTVVSSPGHGTTVTTRLPFTEPAEAVSA
jgi:signal transduction histidine kinase